MFLLNLLTDEISNRCEDLPRKLVDVLRTEGHAVESVHTLRLQGLANGKLYEFSREGFDLCFTRDGGFANAVRGASSSTRFWVKNREPVFLMSYMNLKRIEISLKRVASC